MGKSIRSKVKKRFRTVKREFYQQEVGNEKLQRLSEILQTSPGNHDSNEPVIKNAFLFPMEANTAFPQYNKSTLIDFRSANIDFGGYEFRGSYRRNKDMGSKSTFEVELEEIPEVEEYAEEDDLTDIDEDDLLEDFRSLGLDGATKKIKKKKFREGMETENIVGFNVKKKLKTKNKGGCRKTKMIMKW